MANGVVEGLPDRQVLVAAFDCVWLTTDHSRFTNEMSMPLAAWMVHEAELRPRE
ncbi:hypothetical protein [Methylorubrum populi]|uniref:hypothetical protein n=1 Tax=Methylorubrum populi TaxID=223967 RepID=UPI002F35DC73